MSSDANRDENDPIGTIAIDSIFSPILRVSYDVASTRVLLKNLFTMAYTSEYGEKLEIFEATDGIEAIDVYLKEKPDLVFMDIVMPNMNGINAMKNILKAEPDAKIYILSALMDEEARENAMEEGATDYIVKSLIPKSEDIKKLFNRGEK